MQCKRRIIACIHCCSSFVITTVQSKIYVSIAESHPLVQGRDSCEKWNRELQEWCKLLINSIATGSCPTRGPPASPIFIYICTHRERKDLYNKATPKDTYLHARSILIPSPVSQQFTTVRFLLSFVLCGSGWWQTAAALHCVPLPAPGAVWTLLTGAGQSSVPTSGLSHRNTNELVSQICQSKSCTEQDRSEGEDYFCSYTIGALFLKPGVVTLLAAWPRWKCWDKWFFGSQELVVLQILSTVSVNFQKPLGSTVAFQKQTGRVLDVRNSTLTWTLAMGVPTPIAKA